MTYKHSLFKKCPFEIRKAFKNTKCLILKMKSMLLSNTKNVLFLNSKTAFSQIRKRCCVQIRRMFYF